MDRMAEVGQAEVGAYRVVEEVVVEEGDCGARAVRGRNSDDRTTCLKGSSTEDRAGIVRVTIFLMSRNTTSAP